MSNIKLFQSKQVRTSWDEKEKNWYFAIVDVIEILTDSVKPRDYWYRLKKREKDNGIDLSTICRQLKMTSKDGKKLFHLKTTCRKRKRKNWKEKIYHEVMQTCKT